MTRARGTGIRNKGQAGGSLDATQTLRTDAARLQRLARRVMQEPAQLRRTWLAACAPALAVEDPRALALLERSLTPLCTCLCHARLADAELHVTELVLDLRALAFELGSVLRVLGALGQAFAHCAAQPEGAGVLRALGDFFLATASEAFERTDVSDAALESCVQPTPSRIPLPSADASSRDLDRSGLAESGLAESDLAGSGLVGESAALRQLRTQVAAVAAAPGPALIVGPSGTGKELVARALHRLGPCASRPWVAVNCAALPRELIESELFGHERGAFTGSRGAAPGLMRAAEDGSLFLDEITEMPAPTQAKLLRALEQRSVRPVGGVQEFPMRARVIAATNREPSQVLEAGALRTDLFYRLCVHRIDVPSLCRHLEDLPLLLAHFLDTLARAGQRVPLGFSERSLRVLQRYDWPGNVRELRNLVEHCCAFAAGAWVEPEHLPAHWLVAGAPPERRATSGSGTYRQGLKHAALDDAALDDAALGEDLAPLEDVERQHIQRALRRTGGNKAQAARLLRVSRHQLYVRLERLGITVW